MNLSDQHKKFLNLCIVEQIPLRNISEIMGIPRTTLSNWYDELKEERMAIASIRILWNRKKIKLPFLEFYSWYISHERKCIYCQISEEKIKELIDKGRLETKRLATRGRKLELERKNPNLEYDNIGNLAFACYWCNNAKTDTFSEEEFLKVGKVFNEIWNSRLEK